LISKKFSPRSLVGVFAGATLLAAALTLPVPGGAQEVEVGDVMAKMEGAYTEVVKALLLFPVQESGNEAPFPVIQANLKKLAKIAKSLPEIENYKKDASFRNHSLKLEAEAGALSKLAAKKDSAASISALFRLQAACLACHNDFRF
jgi:cytochrome c556